MGGQLEIPGDLQFAYRKTEANLRNWLDRMAHPEPPWMMLSRTATLNL